ncbi:MAG: GNAT family N-acetyltransferase [Eubacteriales bacterium]|nr:GNAT family N-acetyltransferase [Eubacteriales bacterium]
MTRNDIWRIAMEQSCVDFNCPAETFTSPGVYISPSVLLPGAKKCYHRPMFCGFATYGDGLAVMAHDSIREPVEAFLRRQPGFRAFDAPQIIALDRLLMPYGKAVCFLAEFFLPDPEKSVAPCPGVEIRLLEEEDIPSLYGDKRFPMALSYQKDGDKRDVLAAVGYVDGQLAGVAGASNDCDTMWQLGIDVLPAFRRRGVAGALTKTLSDAVLRRGKIPYFCTAWSNIASKSNALRSGYRTAWVELGAIDRGDALSMIGEPNPKQA